MQGSRSGQAGDVRRLHRRAFLKQLGVVGGALVGSHALTLRVQAQARPAVVRVGTLIDYTGALAEFGPSHRNAVELAAAQLNEAAQRVLGGPLVELVHEDSGTTASVGIDRARKLVEVDRVPAIIGSLASGVTIPVAESVTIPAGVVQISQASTSPLITFLPADTQRDFLFRTVASDALQGVVAAQLAAGEIVQGYRVRRAATIYVNNPYGQGLSNGFAHSFQLRGGIVTAQVPVPEEPKPTYTAELALALRGDPEVIFAATYPGQAVVYMKEAVEVFGFSNFQYTDGTKSEEIVRVLGASVVEGQLGTAPGSDPEWEGFRAFAQAYEARYGQRPPLPYMDTAYDAMAVIGLAIARAHLDGVAVTGAALRDRLRQVANPPGERVGPGEFERALRLLQQGQSVDYTGAAGPVDFDDAGDVVTPVEVWRYAGGTIETVTIRRADQIPAE
ncbi:ABC transporter substrate-binding protein [Geochorda subterranea]|uniref:ABC transporter substrate-binding protein n=1 Tax=Geochorda subterranea TaxID=3109564 RepID=A0ABZ1BPU3_9FIRM|nr:ABC transporter substrate-binding protein [Limnochorda sp. LNt]WRP14416.1 ABC transporter substrate-binding protein [Limnochorda sp. LNt]